MSSGSTARGDIAGTDTAPILRGGAACQLSAGELAADILDEALGHSNWGR